MMLPFQKTTVALGLILFGVVLTVSALYLVADKRSPEELRHDYIVDYTKKEQASLGVNCLELRADLLIFLEALGQSVLSARRPGEDWSLRVTDLLKTELEKYRQFVFTCRQLYVVSSSGKLNGLHSVGFAVDIFNDYQVMDVLLRIGPPRQNCDAKCLDSLFLELRSHYETILNRLKQT